MRIRRKLLLLVVFLGVALLVNLLALGFLAHTLIASMQEIERVALDQQLRAVTMHARLRDGEAALYRYLIEGESGFKEQYEAKLASFAEDVATYRSQASNAAARRWADELAAAQRQALVTGAEMIRLRDQQAYALDELDSSQARLSGLLGSPPTSWSPDDNRRRVLDMMRDNLRNLTLATTGYLARPDSRETVAFTEAVVALRQAAGELNAAAQAPQERAYVGAVNAQLDQLARVGLQLINGRSQQQSLFASFAANLFHAGQEILVGQVQPQATRNLLLTQEQLHSAAAISVGSSLFVALFASIIAGVVTLPLLRRMDTGIQSLLDGAGRVGQGDLTQPVAVAGEDELAQLAEVFNAMMVELSLRAQRSEARLAELETLRRVGLQLSKTLDPQQVLGTIASSTLRLVSAAEVRIFMMDGRTGQLTFAAHSSRNPEEDQAPRQLREDGVTTIAARTARTQVVNNAAQHPLFSSPTARTWGITAAAALPLRHGDRVLGVLNVSLDDRSTFSEDDLRILALLSDQAAVALENSRLYVDLAERESHLRVLVRKLAQTQEEERRLIGLDLHDGLTQLLLSANMHLGTLASVAGALPVQAAHEMQLTQTRLGQAIDEVRAVIAELRPAALDEGGLVPGLRAYATDVARHTGWHFEFSADMNGVTLTSAVEAAIFRIAQEAIGNARKYACTERLRLQLCTTPGELVLAVQDWGQGFSLSPQAPDRRHLGLEGMRERAAALGGDVTIDSVVGTGTRIEARLPLFAVEEP